jgi:hypothetical protein
VAQPNYQFEKRQKDLAKKKKREEKLQRKTVGKTSQTEDGASENPQESVENPAEHELSQDESTS